MTKDTTDTETDTPHTQEALTEQLAASQELFRALSRGLSEALADIQSGKGTNFRELTARQRDLEQALKTAIELENKLDERRTTQSGRRDSDPIDFDEIRRSIGCRLGRIRECCHSE